MSSMRTGAVAVLDALGFKGIWRDCDPEHVIAKLKKAVKVAADDRKDRKEGGFDRILRRDVQFLSDTVVAGVYLPEEEPRQQYFIDDEDVLSKLCDWVQDFTYQMLTSDEPALAYRGAIAFGEFLIDDQFIIGPAVDEAAESEKLAEGAFVWLTPSALKRARENAVSPFPHAVPLKDGRKFATLVVPPAWPDESRAALDRAFRMPSDRLDVNIKYQNTIPMMDEAIERHHRDVEEYVRQVTAVQRAKKVREQQS